MGIETEHDLASEPGYENMVVYDYNTDDPKHNLCKMADTALLHFIHSQMEKGSEQSDFMGAVILGLHMLSIQFSKSKGEKRMYIFTDLTAPLNLDGLEDVANKMTALGVFLTVILLTPPEDSDARVSLLYG